MSYIRILKEEDDSPARAVDIKHENRHKVLQSFRFGRECTVADVSLHTDISKITVMRAIQFFCSRNILTSAGFGESSDVGGKKPECFVLEDQKLILCIAMWPKAIQLSLFSLAGERLYQTRYSYDAKSDLDQTFTAIQKYSQKIFQNYNFSIDNLYAVVLSTSGTVDYATGYLHYSSNSPQWGTNVDLSPRLRHIFGKNVALLVENAGKATGMSVLAKSSELRNKSIVTLFTSWGISGCLIQDGEPLSGKDSLIGEIGHMTIERSDPEVCGCGKRGCLERLVSIDRMRKTISEQPSPSASLLYKTPVQAITFQDIFAACNHEDAYACELVKQLAQNFAVALHNIALVYNPDHVVFQGDFGKAPPYFDQCLKEFLREFKYYGIDGAFEIGYDDHDIYDLNAQGSWYLMNESYFMTPTLYYDV
ncbi:MAG: ROK family protein [Clostridiales bacterium]|nr:ROK family protein [Clostridiales bacterium]